LPKSIIHLVNPLTDRFAGAERHALQLHDLLKDDADVRLWTEVRPDPRIIGYPVRRIRPSLLRFPRRGTIIFIGVFYPVGRWIRFARPERIILIYNTPSRDALRERYRRLRTMFPDKIEIVHVSRLAEELAGVPGRVEYPAMDFEGFEPRADRVPSPRAPFTIGRLSRPVEPKHHPDDAALYRHLAAAGYRIRLMGVPPAMTAQLRDVAGIEILEQGAEPAADFLRSLDCLFYRTADEWSETWGRVVSEAMACGLPIVVE
jgi:glycosyltransferase involved in cell wall biosynthesis